MAKKVYCNLDLNKNQLLNAAMYSADTAPESPAVGQMYFDTTTGVKALKVWDGSAWISLKTALEKNKVIVGSDYIDNIARWASAFVTTTAYNIGDIVTYSSAVYICIATHAAGAWDASHFQILGGGSGSGIAGVTVDGTSVVDTADDIAKLTLDSESIEMTTGNKLGVKVSATQGDGVTVSKEGDGIKVAVQDGTTAQKGLVQLSSAVGAGTDESKAVDAKAVKDYVDGLDVTEFQLASVASNVVTIKGIKETDGKIEAGTATANDIVLEEVAYTGKAEDVAVTAFTGMTATDAQNAFVEAYADEAVTVTAVDGAATDTYLRKYTVEQIGVGSSSAKTLSSEVKIPRLQITSATSSTAGVLKDYYIWYDTDTTDTTKAIGKIEIPKDWLLKAAYADQATAFAAGTAYVKGDVVVEDSTAGKTLYVVKEAVTPTTWAELTAKAVASSYIGQAGKKYLVMWMNVQDSTETQELILIDITELAPVYTASKGITLSGTDFQHTNTLSAAITDANHVIAAKYDAYGHVSEYDSTYVAQLKKVSDVLGAGDTTLSISIPSPDSANTNLDYKFTKTAVDGEECFTDVVWDSTNKKVTVSIAQAISSAMNVDVYYTIA